MPYWGPNLLAAARKINQLAVIFLLPVIFSACSPASPLTLPTSLPTEYLPTIIALTIQAEQGEGSAATTPSPQTATSLPASASLTPTLRRTPAPTSATATLSNAPTNTPTPEPTLSATPTPTRRFTSTPTPTPTPEAAIQILDPGPESRMVSPVRLNTYLKPGLDGRVQIELIGEDGRILVRKVYTYRTDIGRTYLTEDLEYEIRAVAEAARLRISTFDTFKRLLAINSVDILLLSFGEDDLNPPGNLSERILIDEPLPNKLIQGGMLTVAGMARPSSDLPLLIELTTSTGKVVGYRQAGVIPSADGGYVPFRVEVPYSVDEATWVRLSVREDASDRISGTIYLTSLEVLLSP